MNIEHISVSRKGCFETCEQQYKYKYHLKVKSTEPEPFYFTYGKIIHKIAELYVESKGKTDFSKIVSSVIKGKIPFDGEKPAPEIPTEYLARMGEHLRNLKKIIEKVGFDGFIEYKFKYDLEPPKGKIVTGFIDRLVPKGKKYFLIDYKTTKRGFFRKTHQNIGNDIQLRCYAKVIQKEFNVDAANITAGLYYLEGGDLVGTKFTQESIDSAEKDLLEVYDRIYTKNPDLVVGNVGSHCHRCDYKKICPFFNQ